LKRRASRRARAAGSIRRPRRQGSNRLERQASTKSALTRYTIAKKSNFKRCLSNLYVTLRRRRFNGENQLEGQTTNLGQDDPESGDPLIGLDGIQSKPKGVKQTVAALFQNGINTIISIKFIICVTKMSNNF